MEHILEIIGTVIGILYLWLEYRASIYLWIAGIIMPAVYILSTMMRDCMQTSASTSIIWVLPSTAG